MSRVAELLAAKRQAQIDAMTGRESEVDEQAVDAELSRVSPPERESGRVSCGKLVFTKHARKRMAQRGMTVRVVYGIYQCGEPTASGSDIAFTLTDRALAEAPASFRRALSGWRGAAIIVASPDEQCEHHRVRTVLADGRDTRTFSGPRRSE